VETIVKSALEEMTIEAAEQYNRIGNYCIQALSKAPSPFILSTIIALSDIRGTNSDIDKLHTATIVGYRKLGELETITPQDVKFIKNIIDFYSTLCAYVLQSLLIQAGVNDRTATKLVIDTSLIILLNTW
jgi:hypothetical protein